MISQYETELELTPEEAVQALSDRAEAWNGAWSRQGSGGQLTLPVAAGVRSGVLHGSVSVRPSAAGVHVVFHVERSDYSTNAAAVGILALGALGVLAMLAWPLLPGASPNLAASGFLLVVMSWFMVVSRLRHRSAHDFLTGLGPGAGKGRGSGKP